MPIPPFPALALAGAALWAAAQAPAPDTTPLAPGGEATPAVAAPAIAPAAASGMVVYRDPESGRLTSTPPEGVAPLSPELEAALDRSSEGLFETLATDGSPMIDLQGRFQNVMLAGGSAAGAHTLCTTSRATAREAVAAAPTSGPAPAAGRGEE